MKFNLRYLIENVYATLIKISSTNLFTRCLFCDNYSSANLWNKIRETTANHLDFEFISSVTASGFASNLTFGLCYSYGAVSISAVVPAFFRKILVISKKFHDNGALAVLSRILALSTELQAVLENWRLIPKKVTGKSAKIQLNLVIFYRSFAFQICFLATNESCRINTCRPCSEQVLQASMLLRKLPFVGRTSHLEL